MMIKATMSIIIIIVIKKAIINFKTGRGDASTIRLATSTISRI